MIGADTVEQLMEDVRYTCMGDGRPMIWGPPGVGKTKSLEALALRMNRRLVVVIGSYVDPTTMGFPVLDPEARTTDLDGRVRRVIDTAPQKLFTQLNDGPPWLLFLDELTSVPASVLAPWLRLVDAGYVGDYRLDMRRGSIVAAANSAEQAVNGSPLPDPMVSRLDHYRFPVNETSALEWANGSFVNYWGAQDLGWPRDSRPTLGNGATVGDEHVIKARAMFSEFVRRFPAVWHPAIDGSKYTYGSGEEGWSCARSLDRAARYLAIGLAEGLPPVACLRRIQAAIGPSAAIEFQQYVATADVPDPEAVLADPTGWTFSGRVDLDYALMLALAAAVAAKPTAARIIAAFTVCARSTTDRSGAPAKEAAMAAVVRLGKLVSAGTDAMKIATKGMTAREIEDFAQAYGRAAAPFAKYVSMMRGVQ